MEIRAVRLSDAPQIVSIYNLYVATTTISFEEQPVTEATLARRIEQVIDTGLPWLVAEQNQQILGYAYAHQWNARSAYRYTVEPSIYLAKHATGAGIGRQLYQSLIKELQHKQLRNAIATIAQPNPASVRLHEALGFIKVGEFNNVGVKFGREISVGYWQLNLATN